MSIAPSDSSHELETATVIDKFIRDLGNLELDESQLFNRLARDAQTLTGAAGACVLSVSHNGATIVAASGTAMPYLGLQMSMLPFLELAIASGTPQYTNDANRLPVDPEFHQPLSVQQVAVAPIVVNHAVNEVLWCVNSTNNAFTDNDTRLLGQLANVAAVKRHHQGQLQRTETEAVILREQMREAKRDTDRHITLARIARELVDSVSYEHVCNRLANILRTELQVDGIGVYSANIALRLVHLEFQSGAGTVDAQYMAPRFWDSVFGEVVRSAIPVFIEDLASHPAAIQSIWDVASDLPPIASVAVLPLKLNGQVRGILGVRFLDRRTWSPADRQLFEDIASYVSSAKQNLSHVVALERRANRLGALTQAQQQLAHVTSLDTLPMAIANAMRHVFPLARCEVFATRQNLLVRVLSMHDGHTVDQLPATDDEMKLCYASLHSGVSRLAVHLYSEADTPRGTSELCAVIRYGSRSTGVLRLLAATPDAFDFQDLDLITILTRQVGAVVERSRTFTSKEFQRQRAEGAAELARVTLLADGLKDGAHELLGVLDRFVPSIGKALAVSRMRDGIMEYVATRGTLDNLLGHRPVHATGLQNFSPSDGTRVLDNLQSAADPLLQPPLPDEWGLVVPFFARERLFGVLLVTAPKSAPLPMRDRVTLERLASSLAVALEALVLDEDEYLAREREQLLATALTTIDYPIFILDHTGIRFANPAAALEYGWSQSEMLHRPFQEFVAGVDDRQSENIGGRTSHGDTRLSHHLHRRRDGSEFPAAVSVSSLRTHDGESLGQVVSVRNITADRTLEEQLRQTEKMIALGELVAGVAHEINNPLTGISAFAQLLLEEELSDDQRESIRLIKLESERATAVIRDLLVFARKSDPLSGPVHINNILQQALRLRAYPLRNAGITVFVHADESVPQMLGNSQRLQQVMINLIGNAEHAMAKSALRHLTIRTTMVSDGVQVTIQDTGHGMTPDVQRRIFEPFFTTKPAGVGTGLGLSVSFGIIQAHHGRIDVLSEPDVGTTITLHFPIA